MTAPAINLIEEVGSLGSLPRIHRELDAALNDPLTSIDRLGEIIEHDLDLTSRLLRIANSSFYGFPRKIESVARAITLVGLQQVHDLITGTLVIEFFKGISSNLVDLDSFWKHSVATGVCSRVLSVSRRDTNPERHFVSGLLHDIGRLIIYMKAPEIVPAIFRSYHSDNNQPLYLAEEAVLGTNHAELGGALLELWNFPPSLVQAVQLHHAPHQATDFPIETAIVHVSDIVAQAMQLGTSGERFPPPLDHDAWSRLGLCATTFNTVLSEVDRQFQDATSMFLD